MKLKNWLAMKLTAVLLTCCLLQAGANEVTSQTVTLRVKNAPLEKVFTEIKKQTGYTFAYTDALRQKSLPVTLTLVEAPLTEALTKSFQGQPFTYKVIDKVIIINSREQEKKEVGNQPLPSGGGDMPAPPPTVHGRITNEKGEPVAGVSISLKGGKVIGVTNDNGEFTLSNVPDNATLVFSAVTIETFETKLNGRTELALNMKTKVSALDEVQIIAYGQTSKRLQTGNVTTVKGEDIAKQPVSNPLLALQGRVPGLIVNQNTGYAGAGVTVRIQGQNSIAKGSDPLFVIDGVPFVSQLLPTLSGIQGSSGGSGNVGSGNPLTYINPADIESIEILKDADATSIYGSRAASGAILITTKRGKSGRTSLDINIRQGIADVVSKMKLLNSSQFLAMRREAKLNDNAAVLPTDYDLNGTWDTTRYTDWQKELIGRTAKYTDANLSLSGGSLNTQFFLSAFFHRETTVIPGDFHDLKGGATAGFNNISNDKRFKSSFKASFLYDRNLLPTTDLTSSAITLAPVAPALYNTDGSINWAPNASGTNTWPSSSSNPVASLEKKYLNITRNLVTNASFSYLLAKGLELKTDFGYSALQTRETNTTPLISVEPESRPFTLRSTLFGTSDISSWIIEPQVKYQQSLWNGKLEFLMGTTFNQQTASRVDLSGTGFNSDVVLEDIRSATTVRVRSTVLSDYRYSALFARANYNYGDKYIINLTARRDGSSRFGDESKFHNFGSVGAAWIFTKEGRILDQLPFLDFGKIRASFGTTGSDQIGDYQYLSTYNALSVGVPYQGISGLRSSGIPNPYLQWEETKKFQVGLDLSFWQRRISFGVTYYRNRSSNQLLPYSLPVTTGYPSIAAYNFPATIDNTGWEFSLLTENFQRKNFRWSTSINLTIPRNVLVDFPNLTTSSYSSSLVVGEPFTITKVYHFLGVNPATGKYQVADANGNPTSTPNYSTDAKTIINTSPTLYGGLNNTIVYKAFSIDFTIQLVSRKGSNFNYGSASVPPGYRGLNQPISVLNRWRNAGDVTSIQKFNSDLALYDTYGLVTLSDAVYSDATYARLKNVSFSWDISAKINDKTSIKSMRLFIQAQNLATITKYVGLDPETLSVGVLPPLRVITIGTQITF